MGLFEAKKRKPDEVTPPPMMLGAPVPPPPERRGPAPVRSPDYGIDKAIELMRRLPNDNVELVVQVVKTTLESIRVKVSTIIEDAERKEARLENEVLTLRREIADLEEQIARRKAQIEVLEADHDETRSVKEKLQLAEGNALLEDLREAASEPQPQNDPAPTDTPG